MNRKALAYMQIETLEEYVLIAQDFVQIEVIRKSDGWKSRKYFLGDEVTFTSIGLTLSVEAIYDGVENDEMVMWLKQK
jgi:Uma2 family endonuclease